MLSFILLNLVWGTLVIGEYFIRYWYLIPMTIIIETVLIKIFASYEWGKATLIAIVGNLFSGVIGTIVFGTTGIWIDALADIFLRRSNYDILTTCCAWLLMFIGSFIIEYGAVRLLFKNRSRTLFWAVLSGNALSYIFIAILLIMRAYKVN